MPLDDSTSTLPATSPPQAEVQPPLIRAPLGQAAPDPFAAPSASQTFDAALRQQNPIASVITAMQRGSPSTAYDPSHNPLDLIRGTKYEADHLSSFTSSPNEATTRSIMARIDQEDADRKTLAASGWGGTVASIAAGLVDPTMYLPFLGAARAGGGVLAAAGRMALLGGLQSSVSEVALQASQQTRTFGESVGNVASGTLLMGILGAGAHALLSPAEIKAATANLDSARGVISAEGPAVAAANENAPFFGPGVAQAAGAAASDVREMKLKDFIPIPQAVKDLPIIGSAFETLGNLNAKLSPTLRGFSNPSLAARRFWGDAADTPLRFAEGEKGVTPSFGGPPVDLSVKQQINGLTIKAHDTLRDLFVDYRYGENQPSLAFQRAAFDDLRGAGDGKMSYAEFKAQVAEAMWSGDQHAIPQVQQAAQELRQKVLDPVKGWAQETMGPDGKPMLGEELAPPAGDQSFFPRQWRTNVVEARRTDLKGTITDWLAGEQAQKAATKDRLTSFQADLEASQKRISDLEAKAARMEETSKARADVEFDARVEAEKHDAIRAKIEKEIEHWHGDTTAEAKAALKERARAEGERSAKMAAGTSKSPGERLRSADSAVDRAVKHILESDRDLPREELAGRADEIIDRIVGSPDGRIPYDIASGGPAIGPTNQRQAVRGSLKHRDFAIPTSLVKDFVETDVEHALAAHLRTVVPDIALTRRFGDVEATDVMRRVNEDYARMADAAKSEKELKRIADMRRATIRDIAAQRDRIRGVYGWSPDPRMRNAARYARAFGNVNSLAGLGTSVANRQQDLVSAVARYGFMNVMRDAYVPFFKGMLGMSPLPKAMRAQAKAMAVGVDGMMGHMRTQFADVTENYRPGSKFERGLGWAADRSMLVNLHGPWTDWMKTLATSAASQDFLRDAKAIAEGAADPKALARMAGASIDPHMAARIWKAFTEDGGEKIDGVNLPNTGDWKDAGARQAFEFAMLHEANIAVVTPGAERPLWMSNPIIGLIGQFKSFIAGAHERILLANLQQRDGRTLQGFFALIGAGLLSYRLYTLVSGQQTSDKPQDWIKEAVHRSAVTGWFSELNAMQSRLLGGSTDAFRLIGAGRPLSNRADRSGLSELLGPTWSHLEAMKNAGSDASRGTWTATDTHKLREVLPLQNLWAFRRLLDEAEDGISNAFGIKPRVRPGEHPAP